MKSLSDHNRASRQRLKDMKSREHLAGVICDDCGAQMIYPEPMLYYDTHPPCQRVECLECGKTGLKY